jgi:hypothetical protein
MKVLLMLNALLTYHLVCSEHRVIVQDNASLRSGRMTIAHRFIGGIYAKRIASP